MPGRLVRRIDCDLIECGDDHAGVSTCRTAQRLQNFCGGTYAPLSGYQSPELGPQMSGTSDHRKAEEEYRKHAAELSQIAEHTEDPAERERLLRMAEAWLQLAERMKNLSGRNNND